VIIMFNTNKLLISFIIFFVTIIVAVSWFSPYWTLKNVQYAWVSGQSALLHDYIDYPELRNNIKKRINIRVMEKIPGPQMLKDNAGRAVMIIAGPLVDRWITEQQLDLWFEHGRPIPASRPSGASIKNEPYRIELQWTLERQGLRRAILIVEENKEMPRRLELILERRGVISWVLVDVDFNNVIDYWLLNR